MAFQGWHEDRPRKRESSSAAKIPLFDPPHVSKFRAWVMIILSVLVVVGVTLVNRDTDTKTKDAAIADEVVIQSRQALSLMRLETEDIVLVPMRDLAVSPSATRRVATTWAALDRGDGNRSLIALSLMSRIPSQVAAGAELGAPKDLDPLLIQAFFHPQELAPEEQAYIQEHVGWPAKILFVRDLEEDSPVRIAIHNQASRNASWSAAIVTLGVLATMLGSVFLTNFLQRWRRRGVVFELHAPKTNTDIYLEAFAVYVVLMAVAVVAGFIGSGAWFVAAIAQLSATFVGIAWPALRGIPTEVMFRDLGLHKGEGFVTEVWAGLVGYVTVLPLFAVGVVAMVATQKLLGFLGFEVSNPVHPEMVGLGDQGLSFRVYIIAAAVVVAPVVEEIMFRGALFRALRSRWSFVPSALLVGLMFAAVHPQGLLIVPALTAIGVGFSGLREWRDSLIAPMVAHALHNGTLICLTLILLS